LISIRYAIPGIAIAALNEAVAPVSPKNSVSALDEMQLSSICGRLISSLKGIA